MRALVRAGRRRWRRFSDCHFEIRRLRQQPALLIITPTKYKFYPRRGELSESRWPPPPMDVRKPRGNPDPLLTPREGIGYLMEGDQTERQYRGNGSPKLSLTGQNVTAEIVISLPYSVERFPHFTIPRCRNTFRELTAAVITNVVTSINSDDLKCASKGWSEFQAGLEQMAKLHCLNKDWRNVAPSSAPNIMLKRRMSSGCTTMHKTC
ncbi:hypothetical protein EVAR_71371_1 [Eumeta japonica]|uniref:Uncharacterized protein n=1 Tax=Eumeta variegata TaxID=151549 RepID=A0A4C2A5S8_EUMVA|nr:hypothetical protein EVAR_71371_1 [Eumeta japonica]